MKKIYILSLSILLLIPLVAFAQNPNEPLDRFGIGPVYDNDRFPGWLIYELKPGESFEDKVFVQNRSFKKITLRIYAQDAANNSKDKNFQIYNENQTPTDKQFLNNWITLEKNEIVLAPGEGKEIKFIIKIPPDAQKKEYAGVIFAHLDPGGKSNEEADISKNQSVTTVSTGIRIGERIYLTVTDNPDMPKRYKPIPSGSVITQYMFFSIVIIGIIGGSYFIFGKDIKHFYKRVITRVDK